MTAHFSIEELRGQDAPPEHQGNLERLMVLLEECRTLWGDRAVHITSGYRTLEHNLQIGGARGSQHLLGQAADLHVQGLSAREAWLLLLRSEIVVGQAILYSSDGRTPGTFLHLSTPSRAHTNQFLWTPASGGSAGPYYRTMRPA
jgi:hypothetical protein